LNTQRGHSLLGLGVDILAACCVKLRGLETLASYELGIRSARPRMRVRASLLPRPLPRFSVSCAALGYARHPSLGFDGTLVGNPAMGAPLGSLLAGSWSP